VRWSLQSPRGDRLDLTATIGGRTTGLLHSPVRTQMHQRVAETLDGTVQIRFADASGRTRFEGVGQCAGVEVHGAIDQLLAPAGR
jgi:tocopherol cyclase